MNVRDRIKAGVACSYIDLNDAEAGIYTGAGLKMASFENGRLTGFFDPLNLQFEEERQVAADAAVSAAKSWLESQTGEAWLVMCSCFQLCYPCRIDKNSAADLAHMARRIGDYSRSIHDQ